MLVVSLLFHELLRKGLRMKEGSVASTRNMRTNKKNNESGSSDCSTSGRWDSMDSLSFSTANSASSASTYWWHRSFKTAFRKSNLSVFGIVVLSFGSLVFP